MWLIFCLLLAAGLVAVGIFYFRERRANAALRKQSAELLSAQERLRSFALSQLIQGHAPRFELMPDYNRLFHLDFPGDGFILLVVKVRHHPFGADEAGSAAAYSAVQEELTGMLELTVHPYFAEQGGVLVCFYCEPKVTIRPPSQNQYALRALLGQQCAACAAALWETQKIDTLFAIGSYDLGGFGLHANFTSTKALLEQAMCAKWPDNVIMDAEELSQKSDVELSGALRQFYNCFVCFKFDAAAEYLFRMVQLRIENYYDSFIEAREVVAKQLRFCANMLELPLNVQLSLPDGSVIGIRELILDSPNLDVLHENLKRYFTGLSYHVSASQAEATPTIRRVYNYIKVHYADPNISVSSISENFRLNVSYLSRQFKQEYGCGVLEFIHKQRISAAKELMNRGTPVGDIYPLVGYANRRAFDSAFRRYEGVTPKVYQDQLPERELAV